MSPPSDGAPRSRFGTLLLSAVLFGAGVGAYAAQDADSARRAYEAGRYDAAIESWDRALSDSALISPSARAEIMVSQAEAYLAAGYVEKALSVARAALSAAEENNGLKAMLTGIIGRAQQASGDLDAARQSMQSSLELARAAQEPRIEAAARNNLANLLAISGDRAGATALHRENIAQTARIDPVLHVQALANASRVARDAGSRGDAEDLLGRASAAAADLPSTHAAAYALLATGNLYTELHNDQREAAHAARAYAALKRALDVAGTLENRYAQSYALGFLGRLYALENRMTDATSLNDAALSLARELDAPELAYRWYWQRGRLLRAQNISSGAIEALRRAVESLQLIRNDLFVSYVGGKSSFREIQGPLYFELADALLKEAARANDPAQVQAYLREARDTVERSKSAELQDYFQDQCVAALHAQKAAPESVPPKTAVIYPILLPDRTVLLVAYSDAIRQYAVPVGAASLAQAATAFRAALERRTTRQYLPLAQRLYETLVKPLEPDLASRGIHTLVFVPDGALRTIPVAALHDGRQFVVERFSVATTPALSLTDARPTVQGGGVVLGGLTDAVQGFPPLPYVNEELAALEALGRGRVYKNRDFVRVNVERAIGERPVSIVHMATHGVFRSDSRESFILTHDGKLTLNDLERVIGATRFRAQPIDLLTLSACQTAAGDDRAALGLGGIAVKSGAKAALATLWFISDQSSAALVTDFYKALRQSGVTKAGALRQAQLRMLADNRFSHPGYWAPFLLIGNWL